MAHLPLNCPVTNFNMNSHNETDNDDSEMSNNDSSDSEMDSNESNDSEMDEMEWRKRRDQKLLETDDTDSEMDKMEWRNSRNQQLLKSLRESIVDKPPYISGTLPLPLSCFSLFYKDGLAARFAGDPLTSQVFQADISFLDILTLSMLLQTSWNSSLRPVNQLLLA